MLRLIPDPGRKEPLSVLCLGAHSDDIEIGCGGTVLRLLAERPDTLVCWVVLAAKGLRRGEAEKSADLFLKDAGDKQIIIREFEDGFFPYAGSDIKRFFESLKEKVSPDLIFTHYRHDLHQDHRLVSELTWNTFRNHLIMEYEIVKYDGDIGTPNFYVDLNRNLCETKIDYLLFCFQSQQTKAWFTAETFYAMLRLRGIESNAHGTYAEGFYCRKLVY